MQCVSAAPLRFPTTCWTHFANDCQKNCHHAQEFRRIASEVDAALGPSEVSSDLRWPAVKLKSYVQYWQGAAPTIKGCHLPAVLVLWEHPPGGREP